MFKNSGTINLILGKCTEQRQNLLMLDAAVKYCCHSLHSNKCIHCKGGTALYFIIKSSFVQCISSH